MKKIFYLLLFLAVLIFWSALFFADSAKAAQRTYDPTICRTRFCSRGADGINVCKSAHDWCIDDGVSCTPENCGNDTYDFCIRNRYYHFGCKCGPLGHCNCDPDSAWSKGCPEGCTNWTCDDEGCTGGECRLVIPPPGDGVTPPPPVRPLPPGVISIRNPLRADTFQELIYNIIDFIFTIALFIAPAMIMVGAFYFLTAVENPQNIETGKKIILWTIIGFVVIMLSRGFIEFLRGALLK